MFKTLIRIAGTWQDATPDVSRATARRIANAYRNGFGGRHVETAKVVRVESK